MRKVSIIVLGFTFLLTYGLAWGDATIESTVKTGGIKGMGASEGTLVKRYQGDRRGNLFPPSSPAPSYPGFPVEAKALTLPALIRESIGISTPKIVPTWKDP